MIKLLWIEVRAGKVRSRGGRCVSNTRIDSRQTQKPWATWVWKWPSELKTSDMRVKVMVRTRNDASHTSKWEKDGNFQCHDGDGKTRFSLFYSQYSRCGEWWNTPTLCSIFFLHEFESESVWVTAIQLFLIERNISRHIHKCSLAKSSSIVGSQYFAHRSWRDLPDQCKGSLTWAYRAW